MSVKTSGLTASNLADRWNRFWFDNEVLRSRLTTFRVVVFGMLAFDMWMLMFVHAPRYGLGEFNVSHVPALDGVLPVPTPALVGVLYLVGGFLALRVALGMATRRSLYALTAIYGGVYFWSQADSYQHHYLLSLVLLLCCFLPLEALPGLDGEPASKARHVRSWAAKLIYVEVSIVYFYTAITKTTHYWLDGWALDRIIQTDGMRAFLAGWAETFGTSDLGPYAFTAHAIMFWQYFVAAAFLVPKLRPVACITGPLFHVMVEVIDLKIGWFSYYMIGLYYILLFPDPWFLAVARPVGRLIAPLGATFRRLIRPRPVDPRAALLLAGAAGVVTLTVVWLGLPIAGRGLLAASLGVIVALTVVPQIAGVPHHAVLRAGVQVAGVLALVVALRGSDALYDYHRYWAGELKRRSHLNEAAEHYELASSLKLTGPARSFALAELYEHMGRPDDARRAFVEGLRRSPDDRRGRAGLARLDARAPAGPARVEPSRR